MLDVEKHVIGTLNHGDEGIRCRTPTGLDGGIDSLHVKQAEHLRRKSRLTRRFSPTQCDTTTRPPVEGGIANHQRDNLRCRHPGTNDAAR